MLDDPRLPERFWSKVSPEPNTGCWLWTGAVQSNGYGRFGIADRVDYAHRIAYRALVAPIPEDLAIDHRCRTRSCCNPAHLEPVTHAENLRRGVGPSALNMVKTHCVHGHEFTPDNIYVHPQRGNRHCLACIKIRNDARTREIAPGVQRRRRK